jgi:hypothetical protein
MDTGLECRDQAFDWAKKSVDEWEVNQRETESAVRRIDLTDR